MPRVHQIGALRVVIYPNDHGPAHVHVIGNDCEAVFLLHCPDGPVTIRENHGFGFPDLRRIARDLNNTLAHLCGKWGEIHG